MWRFHADNGCPTIGVKIYIYDKGTTETKPGAVIVSDTTATLDTTGVTTIPLVTPVNLSGHEELWVAVEWTPNIRRTCVLRLVRHNDQVHMSLRKVTFIT